MAWKLFPCRNKIQEEKESSDINQFFFYVTYPFTAFSGGHFNYSLYSHEFFLFV